MEMARRVAARLRDQPDLVSVAHDNLDRWSKRNADSPSLMRCYDEWRMILEKPLDEVLAILTQETDEGQRLRQNSPFVGILPPAEVWAIKDAVRNGTIPT